MQWLAHIVQNLLARWGYLALAGGLLGESAGLPLPGETVLMYSSFVAYKTNRLSIYFVILIGTSAAILGDNLGYLVGREFGPRFLRWLNRKFHMEDDTATAANLIQEHGAATIYWARFVFGLRTVAGPVAGALGMKWKKFLLYNALGALSWTSAIALMGYLFAAQMNSFVGFIEKVSWGISAAIFSVGFFIWRRSKKRIQNSPRKEQIERKLLDDRAKPAESEE